MHRFSDMEDIADEKENQVILPYCFEKPMIPSRRPIVYRNLADLMTTDYMDDIKAHMYSRENQNDLLNCLQNHRIDEDQRSKMVD